VDGKWHGDFVARRRFQPPQRLTFAHGVRHAPIATPPLLPRQCFPVPSLPKGRKSHAFLSYAHGPGADACERVVRVNAGLKRLGLVTWFDKDVNDASIFSNRAEGVMHSCTFVVLLTRGWCRSVNGTRPSGSCHQELILAKRLLSGRVLAAAMEGALMDPQQWGGGLLASALGGDLCCACFESGASFDGQVIKLASDILRLCSGL
jgi:hypothetical protein